VRLRHASGRLIAERSAVLRAIAVAPAAAGLSRLPVEVARVVDAPAAVLLGDAYHGRRCDGWQGRVGLERNERRTVGTAREGAIARMRPRAALHPAALGRYADAGPPLYAQEAEPLPPGARVVQVTRTPGSYADCAPLGATVCRWLASFRPRALLGSPAIPSRGSRA
jgi:hypothetical protein